MEEVLETFDKEDYDVVKELIPYVYEEAWEEHVEDNQMFGASRADCTFHFNIADRIFWFLIDQKWEADIDFVLEEVEKYFNN